MLVKRPSMQLVPAREWIDDMSNNTEVLGLSDEGILTFEVSDEALEAAAHATASPAMSLITAPTVSVLIACCGNDIAAQD
jgi:hypothetical protein